MQEFQYISKNKYFPFSFFFISRVRNISAESKCVVSSLWGQKEQIGSGTGEQGGGGDTIYDLPFIAGS